MKSTNRRNAGNLNLKGKKSAKLSCGCCEAKNFRDKETKKLHEKEIRDQNDK